MRGIGIRLVALAAIVVPAPAVAATMNFSCRGDPPFHLALDLANKKATLTYERNHNVERGDVSTDPKLGADKVIISTHKATGGDIGFDLKTFKYKDYGFMDSDEGSCRPSP